MSDCKSNRRTGGRTAKKCAYELGRYKEFSAKVKALFLNSSIPIVEVLRKRHTTLQKQYNERSAEYNFYKKKQTGFQGLYSRSVTVRELCNGICKTKKLPKEKSA